VAWGDAKQQLFERIDLEIAPMRASYEELMAHPGRIEDILQAGAAKARTLSHPFMQELRDCVGLRKLNASRDSAPPVPTDRAVKPSIKQYREKDGRFYFKLVDPQGQVLLQSLGAENPREVAQIVAQMQTWNAPMLQAHAHLFQPLRGDTLDKVLKAIEKLRENTNE